MNSRNRNRKWFGFALMGSGEPEIRYSPNNLRQIARLVLEPRSIPMSQAKRSARQRKTAWLQKAIFKCPKIKLKQKARYWPLQTPKDGRQDCLPAKFLALKRMLTSRCSPISICVHGRKLGYLLVGAIAGRGRYVRRARTAFFIAAGITVLVVAFLVVQQIANNNHGKVFGIQIGFQLDHQDGREM
jgi:hypothetical protein